MHSICRCSCSMISLLLVVVVCGFVGLLVFQPIRSGTGVFSIFSYECDSLWGVGVLHFPWLYLPWPRRQIYQNGRVCCHWPFVGSYINVVKRTAFLKIKTQSEKLLETVFDMIILLIHLPAAHRNFTKHSLAAVNVEAYCCWRFCV